VASIRKLVTKDIVIFGPFHTKYQQVRQELGPCEVERVFINGKPDRVHIYLGKLKSNENVGVLKLTD